MPKRHTALQRLWESVLAFLGDEQTLKRRRRSAGAKKAAATRARNRLSTPAQSSDAYSSLFTKTAPPAPPDPAESA